MLSMLKRWLGQDGGAGTDDRSRVTAQRPAVGDFRADLVPNLQAEHKQLLALFAELERAAETNDEMACRSALDRFTRVLQDHLLTENRHLYGYFSRNPNTNPDLARRVDDMSSDMLRIGKMLHRFITTYSRATWTSVLHDQLRKDLRPIGEVLVHRIHEEESVLYPMYQAKAG